MPSLLLYLVIALFAWMGFALFGNSGEAPLTPGFLIVMACLSVVIWDRLVAPMMHRSTARRASAERTPRPAAPARPPAPAGTRPVYPNPPVRPQVGGRVPAAQEWRPLTA